MYEFTVGGKNVSVFPSIEPGAPVIYLNTYSDEGQQVFQVAQAVGCPPFTLAAISNLDWNHDMAPWDNPAAFKGGEPFTPGADGYLRLLAGEILPRAEKNLIALRRGGGLSAIPWPDCSPCTLSARQKFFPARAAYPVLYGSLG